MNVHFRKADISEAGQIWAILAQAIERRKAEGSDQWQDGYPNLQVVKQDIASGAAFVLSDLSAGTKAEPVPGAEIFAYCTVLFNDEPEYDRIEGRWLTEADFAVVHRIAVGEKYLGQGLGRKILNCVEQLALQRNIYSVKVDTNHDNVAMLKILENAAYTYCGQVYFRGSPRRAYEKVLSAERKQQLDIHSGAVLEIPIPR